MKTPGITIAILSLALLFVITGPAVAQTNSDHHLIKVNTVFVNVPVIASDRQGRYVGGLKKDDFTILQDGVKQEIEYFADDSAPMNVAILIDTSGSTSRVLGDIKGAARDFVKTFRPEDKGMVITFDYYTRTLTKFSSDQKVLTKAINKADIGYMPGSNMQDAMYEIATKDFADVKGRKAIIVLTDGDVMGTRVSNRELLYTLAESDILVYPIIFKTNYYSGNYNLPKTIKLRTGETLTREEYVKRIEDAKNLRTQFMTALGTVTGGKLIEANSDDFKESFQRIADELKNQYLIGFYPPNTDDGKPHQIAIHVNPKDIVIRTKRAFVLKPAVPANQ